MKTHSRRVIGKGRLWRKPVELSKNEKLMKYAGLAYALMFIGASLVFVFFSDGMFDLMNRFSEAFFPSLPRAADSGKFWLSLAVSMMATITVLSLFIYANVREHYRMAVPLVAAKFTSSLFGIGFFIVGLGCPDTGWNNLANFAIAVTDFPLGAVMLLFYLRVRRERG